MLDVIRRGAKHVVIKAFLVLLAGTFVLWGVGDVVRGSSSTDVATVDGDSIGQVEFSQALQREVQRYQQLLGEILDDEKIDAMGLRSLVLGQLINERLLAKRLEDLSIRVGDASVKDYIVSKGMFLDEMGEFSQASFEAALRSNGLSESHYIELIKHDIAKGFLLDSLTEAVPDFSLQAKWLHHYRFEDRVVDYAVVTPNKIGPVSVPTDAQLNQYYQEHSNEYRVPELRELTFVTIDQSHIEKEIQLSLDELQEAYNAQIDQYTQPEKRHVIQYLFKDEVAAKEAHATLVSGKSIDASPIDLGTIGADGLLEDIANHVFALEKNVYSQAIQSSLGWHVFLVKDIVQSKTLAFSEVKKDLEKALQDQQRVDVFYRFTNQIEDDLAAGVTLEEMAKSYDLTLSSTPAVSAEGVAESGKSPRLPTSRMFLQTAFSLDPDLPSSLVPIDDEQSFFIVRVDRIVDSRVKALDEVRGVVRQAWKKKEKKRQLLDYATQLVQQVKEGKSLAEVAKREGVRLKRNHKVVRVSVGRLKDREPFLPMALIQNIFSLEKGGVSNPIANEANALLIAQVKDIRSPKVDDKSVENVVAIQKELREQFLGEVLQQYFAYLRTLYPVEVHLSVVDSAS